MARKPIPPGWVLVADVQPKSEWDALPYRVCRETATGAWRCDCKGFIFGTKKLANGDKTCKHITQAQRELQAWTDAQAPQGLTPTTFPATTPILVPTTSAAAVVAGLVNAPVKALMTPPSAPVAATHARVRAMLTAIGVEATLIQRAGPLLLRGAVLDQLEQYLAHLTPVAEIVARPAQPLPTRAFSFVEE